MAGITLDTELIDVPTAQDLARGAVFLNGPEGLLQAWFLIGAFVIVTSSIGLVGTLLLLPLVLLMLGVGAVWLAYRRLM